MFFAWASMHKAHQNLFSPHRKQETAVEGRSLSKSDVDPLTIEVLSSCTQFDDVTFCQVMPGGAGRRGQFIW